MNPPSDEQAFVDSEFPPGGINHEYTSDIVCPHCGCVYSDSMEFGDYGKSNDGEEDCQECGKRFRWERNVSVDYSTEKVTEEKP